jgi:predicted nucleic acid-binding protein
MPANPVLVDSSWYIRLMHEGRNPLRELARIAEVRDVATCGVIRCEVGRGLSDPTRLRKFQALWDAMLFVSTDDRLWRETQALLWSLDRQGRPIPLPDAVIACCARRINAVVLTFDAHFSIIPGIVAAERIV